MQACCATCTLNFARRPAIRIQTMREHKFNVLDVKKNLSLSIHNCKSVLSIDINKRFTFIWIKHMYTFDMHDYKADTRSHTEIRLHNTYTDTHTPTHAYVNTYTNAPSRLHINTYTSKHLHIHSHSQTLT